MSDTRLSMREQLEAAAKTHGLVDDAPSRDVVRAVPSEEDAPKIEERKPVPLNDGKSIPMGALEEHKAKEAKKVERPEPKTEAKPEETPKVDTKPEDVKPEEVKPEKAKGDDVAPGFLSAAGKGKWANLDPILKREFKKYERDIAENGRKLNDELKTIKPEYEEFSRVFTPQLRESFARRGMSPAQVTGQLIALANHAETDWPGFVREQSRLRGFDINTLVQMDDGQSQRDPAVVKLEQELAAIKNSFQSAQQQRQSQTQAEVKAQVDSFRDAVNEDGSQKHPHFERLQKKIGYLMAADENLTLEQAYRDACYADPEVRESVLADEWNARETKRLEELKRQQNAAKSNQGSTNGTTVTALPRGSSIRAQLLSAFDKHAESARVQ